MMSGDRCRRSPAERPMSGHQYRGHRVRIKLPKQPADYHARVLLIVGGNLLGCESRCDRHFTVEVVGVRRSKTGNSHAGLCPGGRELRMRVGDAARVGKMFANLKKDEVPPRRSARPAL